MAPFICSSIRHILSVILRENYTALSPCALVFFLNLIWPNFFLMNVFFALKGSKLFIIISNLSSYFPYFDEGFHSVILW